MNDTEVCELLQQIAEACKGKNCNQCKIGWYCTGYFTGDWSHAEKVKKEKNTNE